MIADLQQKKQFRHHIDLWHKLSKIKKGYFFWKKKTASFEIPWIKIIKKKFPSRLPCFLSVEEVADYLRCAFDQRIGNSLICKSNQNQKSKIKIKKKKKKNQKGQRMEILQDYWFCGGTVRTDYPCIQEKWRVLSSNLWMTFYQRRRRWSLFQAIIPRDWKDCMVQHRLNPKYKYFCLFFKSVFQESSILIRYF